MIRPKRHRPIPVAGMVITRGRIGIHDCIISTPVSNMSSMDILWKPGRQPYSEFLPEFETKFRRLKQQHLQKLADIAQKPIMEKPDAANS
jgi:hypothetical protein